MPKPFKEYKDWLTENALPEAKTALLDCLRGADGKVRMMAVKEVADRLFGKAHQAITNADGSPVMPVNLVELLMRLVERK